MNENENIKDIEQNNPNTQGKKEAKDLTMYSIAFYAIGAVNLWIGQEFGLFKVLGFIFIGLGMLCTFFALVFLYDYIKNNNAAQATLKKISVSLLVILLIVVLIPVIHTFVDYYKNQNESEYISNSDTQSSEDNYDNDNSDSYDFNYSYDKYNSTESDSSICNQCEGRGYIPYTFYDEWGFPYTELTDCSKCDN